MSASVVAKGLETCETNGYWLPVLTQGNYELFCTDSSCARSLHGCTSATELKTRLSRGLDLTTGECQTMDLQAQGITTGRSCRGLEGCSHKTKCQSSRRLSELVSGFDDYYYSASDLDLTLPELSSPTRFTLAANRCGLQFTSSGSQESSGSFGRMGCLSACDIEECTITVPQHSPGSLRIFWSIGSSCGSNRDVKLTMSPPTVFGQAIGTGSLRADLTYVKREELTWAQRTGKLIQGAIPVQQFCRHSEPESRVSHSCQVNGQVMTCMPAPSEVVPEGFLVRQGDSWYVNPNIVTSKDCFDVTLCSSVQEKITWCRSGSTWQPVTTQVNSTVEAPPTAIPWPDPGTSINPRECSLFYLTTCSFMMKIFYLGLWCLIGFLVYKLVVKIIDLCKKRKAGKVSLERAESHVQSLAAKEPRVVPSSASILENSLNPDWVYSRMIEL